MLDIAPGLRIVDLSHGIPPFEVRAGAWVLASALPYTPVGVHVAVVDPGVGTSRLPIVLRCDRGDLLVGPDNGLLLPAGERLGGVAEARRISNPELMRHPVSSTFHGRDIFAPVGAHLAAGLPLEDVGPRLDIARLAGLPWRRPEYEEARATGEVALLDSFGNVRTNIETARWPVESDRRLRVRIPAGERIVRAARTFGEVAPGELFAFDDSSGYACLGVNLGSAGAELGVRPGELVQLERL
jgi:S-adenosylmethionine hydrolase